MGLLPLPLSIPQLRKSAVHLPWLWLPLLREGGLAQGSFKVWHPCFFGLVLMPGPEGLRTLTSWAWLWGESWASHPVYEPLECEAQARTLEGLPSLPQAHSSDLKGHRLFQEPWMASPETDSGFLGSETSRASPLTQTPEHRLSHIRYPGDPHDCPISAAHLG